MVIEDKILRVMEARHIFVAIEGFSNIKGAENLAVNRHFHFGWSPLIAVGMIFKGKTWGVLKDVAVGVGGYIAVCGICASAPLSTIYAELHRRGLF